MYWVPNKHKHKEEQKRIIAHFLKESNTLEISNLYLGLRLVKTRRSQLLILLWTPLLKEVRHLSD